jgi:hypothetical protein
VSERASEDMIAGQRGEVPVGRWGVENFAAFQKAQCGSVICACIRSL